MADEHDALAQCRDTNKRLNRRLQEAEAALCEWQAVGAMAAEQRTGRFHPAMLAWAITKAKEENDLLNGKLIDMYERIIPEEIAKGVAAAFSAAGLSDG